MPPGPKWKDEREPDGEPGGADELSIEERILAEKARAAAAKREAERRGQAQEVSDFLDGILAPAREEPPEGPAGPGVGAVLAAEPGDRGPDAAFAPFAGAAGPAAPGPALSESLAATYLELQALGREGEGLPRLSFEAEEPPAEPGPNIAPPEPPPRRYLALTFEPEGAAAAAAQEEEQKSKAATRHLSPPDILPGDQGTGAAQSPPAAAAPAQEPRAPDGAQYSLDDLPAVPAAEPPQEPSERSFEIEPAMDDSSDDEARLREALAAAEAAARATTLGELKAVPEAGAEPGRGPAAGPAAKQYSIEDLPEAPGGAPRAQPDEPEHPASGDDRLPEPGKLLLRQVTQFP